MARKLRDERPPYEPPGGAKPYRRQVRHEPDPTPPEVKAALEVATDLGHCNRLLKAASPDWSLEKRIETIRDYVRNLQIRWLDSPARRKRVQLAEQATAEYRKTARVATANDDDE